MSYLSPYVCTLDYCLNSHVKYSALKEYIYDTFSVLDESRIKPLPVLQSLYVLLQKYVLS